MTDEELIRKSDVLDDLKAAVAEEAAIRAARGQMFTQIRMVRPDGVHTCRLTFERDDE